MTDLLLSELLVLALLLLPLIRPFSTVLQKGQAIPILPFLGLFVCICIVIGQGFVLSFLPLILLAFVISISEVVRLISFFQGMLNDFYSLASLLLRILLLILFGASVYGVFLFAPEPEYRPSAPIAVQQIALTDQPDNPMRAVLLQQKNSTADKKALVILAEAFPFTGRPGALAMMLAEKGYTVLEINRLGQQSFIPRLTLYKTLIPLMIHKQPAFLPKETDSAITAFFSQFVMKTAGAYGQNKQLFLYTEGIYTDLAVQFCTENPGIFTGVFFHLSDQEPLPTVPDGWAEVCRADEFAASDRLALPENAAAPAVPMRPFFFFIQPKTELVGFGALRADDIAAAELLGSGRSPGRQDKAAAAAAFDRYAVLF